MFKRIILALVCLSFTLSGFAAKLTATLQSGDKVTPFYGDNAFVEAYNAAVNGDIITLSPGSFKATNIEKSITVIGAYAFSEDLSEATHISSSVTISGDNVTLEGIRFTNNTSIIYGLNIKGTNNLTFNRCYIALLNDVEGAERKYHDNTILTDCWIETFNAMQLSRNAILENCNICHFDRMNEIENLALIENCHVSFFSYFEYLGSSTYSYRYKQPYAIYKNCELRLYNYSSGSPIINFSSPSGFHNNCFKEIKKNSDSSSWTIKYNSSIYSNNVSCTYYNSGYPDFTSGSFTPHTQNGISYGPIDHKAYPAIPSITSSEIDTKTDANGNLHVKITAKARD